MSDQIFPLSEWVRACEISKLGMPERWWHHDSGNGEATLVACFMDGSIDAHISRPGKPSFVDGADFDAVIPCYTPADLTAALNRVALDEDPSA